MRVIVVGAGITGLASAYALRKRGVDVTVLERGPIPNPLAASFDHHRLMRRFYGASRGYTARMTEAQAAWQAMWADLPQTAERYYHATGMLAVSRTPGDYTDQSRAAMDELGLSYEMIDGQAALAHRFPALVTDDIRYALMAEGGALMAHRIMVDLADWLRANDADLRAQSEVTEMDADKGTVRLTNGTRLEGDAVLLCAGVATPRLVPDLTTPLKLRRTLMVYAHPPASLAAAWAETPCWNDMGGGPDLWGAAPVDGLPVKLGNGDLGSDDGHDTRRSVSPEEITATIASYRGIFRDIDAFEVAWAEANYWIGTDDATFHLEQRGRLFISSACSGHGFKFGALSGEDLADAVTQTVPISKVAARMAGQPDKAPYSDPT